MKVKEDLVQTQEGSLLTRQACKIQIPKRYSDRNIAEIGEKTYIYGIFALIMDNGYYSVFNMLAMVPILPSRVTLEKVDGNLYHTFHFEAGQVIIPDRRVVKRDILVYEILDEFLFKAGLPWFLTYEDVGKLFLTAKRYANSNIAENQTVMQLFASLMGRNPTNLAQHYRHYLKDCLEKHIEPEPAEIIGLGNVQYSATNTLSKLAGSYYDQAVVSALVNPSESVEKIESLLRA